jgi:hypothetical protein
MQIAIRKSKLMKSTSHLRKHIVYIAHRALIAIMALSLLGSTSIQAMPQTRPALPAGGSTVGKAIMEISVAIIPEIIKFLKEQETINGSKIEGKVTETGMKDPKRVVAQSKLAIDVEEWNSAWYGSIVVKLPSKPTVNYLVDFSKIEISQDSDKVTIRIHQPIEIQVASDNAPTRAEYSFVRKWFGADTRQALETKVRGECDRKAMEEAKKEVKSIRLGFQNQLEDELGQLLAKEGFQKVKVVIEDAK